MGMYGLRRDICDAGKSIIDTVGWLPNGYGSWIML